MKKLTLTFCLILALMLSGIQAYAQIINGGFEDTTSTGPEAWITGAFGADFTSDHAHSGTNSLVVWNWYYYGQGFAINGYDNGNFTGIYMDYGTPLNQVPNSLDGYYMYDTSRTSSTNDTAEIVVTCKRYNNTSQTREIVALGMIKLTATDTNAGFQPFSIPLNTLMPGVQPDSILIVIRSSLNGFCNTNTDGNCLYLHVDDLTLELPTGTMDASSLFSRPRVYPNPVSETLNISDLPDGTDLICLYDVFGRLVAENSVSGPKVSIPTKWPSGAYTVQYSSNGIAIGQSRIIQK